MSASLVASPRVMSPALPIPLRFLPGLPRRPLARCTAAFAVWGVLFLSLAIAGCAEERADEVVVYCALDLEYADAILADFTRETGIHVRLNSDNEITKTVGLSNQIKLEKEHPKADVFWSSDTSRAVALRVAPLFALAKLSEVAPPFALAKLSDRQTATVLRPLRSDERCCSPLNKPCNDSASIGMIR